MASKKIKFTKAEVAEMLRPVVDEIKRGMQQATYNALYRFYHSREPWHYKRTYGMYGLNLYEVKESFTTTGAKITFRYSVEDIELADRHNNVSAVFDADFINGFHGGPIKTEDGYTWRGVPRTVPSPWDTIVQFAKSEYGITDDMIKVR